MLLGPSASPFEIYGASTALLRKFQSSTYHRYASGWNLLSALYLHRLFQKAYGEYVLRYAATANSPRRIRTAMDGGGSTQQRVCAANT